MPEQRGLRSAEDRWRVGPGSVSPQRRDALRRKFSLSLSTTSQLAHEWRVHLRRFNRAEDGRLLFHEFLTAVRSSDVPAASRALGSWSDREVEELWLAVRHDGAPAGTGVDVEELVHFLCSTSTSTGDAPERRNAHSADAPPDGNGDRYAYTPAHSAGRARVAIESGGARHLEDSLDECSSAVRTGATGGLQQRASARASASSPLRAQDEFAWRTASADGRPGGRVAAMSPGKLQRTESAGSTRSTPGVALRRSESIERHVRRMSLSPPPGSPSSRNGSPLENKRSSRSVEHTSARDRQVVQHLEQQLEQQLERIALLNQLQHETEGHVADLRQENARFSSELAAAAASSGETAARLKQRELQLSEQERELSAMKEETGKLLKSLATEEHLKEQALEQVALSHAAQEREEERVSALEKRLQDMTVDKSELAHQKQALSDRLVEVNEELQEARLALQLECKARLRAEEEAVHNDAQASELKWQQVERDKRVAASEAKVAAAQREAQQERQRQVDLARRLEAVEQQLEAARIRLDGAEGNVHATRAAKDDLERRAEAGEHARREVEAQLRAVQERYATAASALEQASATVQQLRGELAQEKQARQLAEDAEQRAGSRVEAMEQSYEMGMEELRAREEQRREAVEREHAARRELEPKVMEAEVRLKNEEQRARDLESKVASLEAQMRSLADANGRLTAELDLSRSAARELKEEMVCVCVCVCV